MVITRSRNIVDVPDTFAYVNVTRNTTGDGDAVITAPAAIRWMLEYRAVAEGEMLTTLATVTADNGAAGDATGYAQYVTKHSQFVLPYNHATQPLAKQDHVFFRLYRDSGVANDFSGTVVVTEFELVYQSVGIPTI